MRCRPKIIKEPQTKGSRKRFPYFCQKLQEVMVEQLSVPRMTWAQDLIQQTY